MNFRHLEIFYAIMLTGSVSAAAKSLHLTQPAASKILRHAEDQLKFSLFYRAGGRLVPTDEALALLPDVEAVFHKMRAVNQSVEDVRTAERGSLRLVAIPSLSHVVIPEAVAAFAKAHPEVPVSFDIRSRRSVMQSVATQRAEVGVVFLTERHAGVQSYPLCRSNIVCIAPKDHPLAARDVVTVEDLEGEALVSFASDQGLQPLIESVFERARLDSKSTIKTGWVSGAWALVQRGAGVALVDRFSQLDRLYSDVAVIPFWPEVPVDVDILTPRGRPVSRVAAQFVDIAQSVLSESEAVET